MSDCSLDYLAHHYGWTFSLHNLNMMRVDDRSSCSLVLEERQLNSKTIFLCCPNLESDLYQRQLNFLPNLTSQRQLNFLSNLTSWSEAAKFPTQSNNAEAVTCLALFTKAKCSPDTWPCLMACISQRGVWPLPQITPKGTSKNAFEEPSQKQLAMLHSVWVWVTLFQNNCQKPYCIWMLSFCGPWDSTTVLLLTCHPTPFQP